MKRISMKVIEIKECNFAGKPTYADMMQAALDEASGFLFGKGLDADSIIQMKEDYFDMRPRVSNSTLFLTIFYKEEVNHDS